LPPVESPRRSGLFRKRLDAFARELPRVEEGNLEALHHARVASRRLRELVPVLELDGETTRKLNRRLRRVTRRLGAVRELDVLMLLIEELGRSGRSTPYGASALEQVGREVARTRAAARERLAAKLPTAKLERVAHELERAAKRLESADVKSGRADAGRPRQAWRFALEARLARRAAAVLAAVEIAGSMYVPEYLHDVRIALKKLRYAAELLRESSRDRTSADLRVLKGTQDVLGRLHDLEVLLEWVRQVQASLSTPDLTAWRDFASLTHAIEDDCRLLHARYMRDRTRLIAIADRMAAPAHHAPSVKVSLRRRA
jgi:CHAD domain-containing protein